MHGIIFVELKKYVTEKLSADTWTTLLDQSGIGQKTYLASQTYPDQEVLQLVTTASKATGTPIPTLLEDFGAFIAPDLVATYKGFIKPEWTAMDLLENIETTIHATVRLQNPGAEPPRLECLREGDQKVAIIYRSPRKMCFVGKGIIRGIGEVYGEPLTITEPACMHRGAAECRIEIATG